jgi:acyl-CoA dehydrogenase
MSVEELVAHEDAFSLPQPQARLREEAEALAARFGERHREVRLHVLERGELYPELWAEIRDRGWPGMLVPSAHGGVEGGLLGWVVVMEALAASNLVLWMPVLSSAIGHGIAEVGPDAAREAWLPRIAAGETHLALAVTEPGCGHNVFRTRTTVRREGEGFVLNGLKEITSGIDVAERVLVFAREPRGEGEEGPARFTTVLVDPEAAGAKRTEVAMGGREGVRQWRLELEDVEAPAEALVGTEGQGLLTLWPITHVERLLTAALSIGNTRYCISRAVAHAGERAIFGERPIGAEQAIQHPLARLQARLEATRLLVYRTAARFDAGVDGFAVAGEANMAKLLTADLLFDAADHLMQTLGGQAWDQSTGLPDLYLDARLTRSGPISQELALNFIAQHVLGLPTHR